MCSLSLRFGSPAKHTKVIAFFSIFLLLFFFALSYDIDLSLSSTKWAVSLLYNYVSTGTFWGSRTGFGDFLFAEVFFLCYIKGVSGFGMLGYGILVNSFSKDLPCSSVWNGLLLYLFS